MADWKGTEVDVGVVREDGSGLAEEKRLEGVLLDTDTMADLLDKYPPSEGWCIVIGSGLFKDLPK